MKEKFLHNKKSLFNRNHLTYRLGFTLVELMVTISIFLLISGVVIFNYGDFRSSVSLQNITDDIALSIRKAQSFAIGARGVDTGGGNVSFNKSYGIHFSKDADPDNVFFGSNKSFLMFSSAGDRRYDESENICDSSNECIEFFKIMGSDTIKEIKLDGAAQSNNEFASLDIVFTRPEPRAYFCFRVNPESACLSNYSQVSIVVSNGLDGVKEKIKTISVQNTGQISIQ